MTEYKYKYQNFLINDVPKLGPLYTSFLVTIELHMEDLEEFSTIIYPIEEMAEIG